MQYTLALLGLATAALANPFPQEAVTENVAPEESTPEGCQPSYEGQFQIQVTNVSSPSTKRSFLNKVCIQRIDRIDHTIRSLY